MTNDYRKILGRKESFFPFQNLIINGFDNCRTNGIQTTFLRNPLSQSGEGQGDPAN